MFRLEFETDNAAFEETPWTETARILRNIADRIEQGREFGYAFDANGNKIGSYSLNQDGDE